MSNYHTYSPYIYDHNKKYYIVDNNWFNDLTTAQQNELKNRFKIGEINNLIFHMLYMTIKSIGMSTSGIIV
jgi:hypothetical protein